MNLHRLIFFSLGLLLCCPLSLWAQDKSAGTAPTYKVSGNALLHSQFIDRGLAISDRNPAMNAAFLFNLGPQFKLGFWGSNISNLSYADDNFWFKVLGEVRIDFNDKSAMELYLNDDHYYKSSDRNGQSVGLNLYYGWYLLKLEWMTNFQGTKTSAQYVNLGRYYLYQKDFKFGWKAGYTLQSSSNYKNYLDAKGYGSYQMTANSNIELGITATLEGGQFGSRADPAAYLTIGLMF